MYKEKEKRANTCCQKRRAEASLTAYPLKLAIAPNKIALGVVYCSKSTNLNIASFSTRKFSLSDNATIPIPKTI